MPDFLTSAFCDGRRPRRHLSRLHRSRPTLTARLLRERHVPRFVIAPDGYGKTGVALDYAEVVFELDPVFWIDGASPCFLRDLDAGIIASGLMERASAPFLAVIDDVPPLDPDRVEALSHVMNELIAYGHEVLITCTPSCDAFESQRDRIVLTATDLLLSEEEAALGRSSAQREAGPGHCPPECERIAALCWGDPEERRRFLRTVAQEELPSDLLLVSFAMLCLGEGSLRDIAAFGDRLDEAVALLAPSHLHLGIDLPQGRFATAAFGVDAIADAFAGHLGSLAARSSARDGDALVALVSDELIARGLCERACEVARALMSRGHRAAWLAEHGGALEDAGFVEPACAVYRTLVRGDAPTLGALSVDEARRQLLLGDPPAACAAARRVLGDPETGHALRAEAMLVLALHGTARERATGFASAQAHARAACRERSGDGQAIGIAATIAVREALTASPGEAVRTWLAARTQGIVGTPFFYAAAAVIATCVDDPTGELSAADEFGVLVAAVRESAREADEQGRLALAHAVAIGAIGSLGDREQGAAAGLPTATRQAIHVLLRTLTAQRSLHKHEARARFDEQRARPHRSVVLPAERVSAPEASEPLLTVNLFGGLDVRIGETRVDPARFSRKKVRTLLALLVLNRGREAPRERLAAQLWPNSDPDLARKNFYGVWSILRRALTTPSGTCPYLIVQQNGLRLDATLLRSDVLQLDDLCRSLLFEHAGYDGWGALYAQVNGRFADDLLPSERECPDIDSLRSDCRGRLVDALIAAGERLVRAGNVREGLWFARAALARDRTREDAYTALMRAQIASGQRTAALETYFSCRKFLADELGIDPSPETMRLYRSVIESEEELR